MRTELPKAKSHVLDLHFKRESHTQKDVPEEMKLEQKAREMNEFQGLMVFPSIRVHWSHDWPHTSVQIEVPANPDGSIPRERWNELLAAIGSELPGEIAVSEPAVGN